MTPPSPPPFPFAAYTKQRSADRAAEKKMLWKGMLALLQSVDLIERAGFCEITLIGVVALLNQQMDAPDFRETAYAAGLAATEGFLPPDDAPRIEPLQIVVTGEPDDALRETLAGAGFRRMADPSARPVIYMGQGLLGAWKPLRTHNVRVFKVDLPVGAIHGAGDGADAATPVTPPDGVSDGAIPRATAVAAIEGAQSLPASFGHPADVGNNGHDTVEVDAYPTVPYRLSAAATPSDRADWTLARASDAESEALMLGVVAAQGPIDSANAVEAARRGLGMGAVRANSRRKLLAALERLTASGTIANTPGHFFALPGQPVLARDRRECDERLRLLVSLPPVEVAAAVCEVLQAENCDREQAAVVVGDARRLGYRLKSLATHPGLAGFIERQIDALVGADVVVRVEGNLTVQVDRVDAVTLARVAVPLETARLADASRSAPDAVASKVEDTAVIAQEQETALSRAA